MNVYTVSVYISVELLSNVDKRNTLPSRNSSNPMFKNSEMTFFRRTMEFRPFLLSLPNQSN